MENITLETASNKTLATTFETIKAKDHNMMNNIGIKAYSDINITSLTKEDFKNIEIGYNQLIELIKLIGHKYDFKNESILFYSNVYNKNDIINKINANWSDLALHGNVKHVEFVSLLQKEEWELQNKKKVKVLSK